MPGNLLNLTHRFGKFFIFLRHFRQYRLLSLPLRFLTGLDAFLYPIGHLTDLGNPGRHFHSTITFFHSLRYIITRIRSHCHHFTHRQLFRVKSHFCRTGTHHIRLTHAQLLQGQFFPRTQQLFNLFPSVSHVMTIHIHIIRKLLGSNPSFLLVKTGKTIS